MAEELTVDIAGLVRGGEDLAHQAASLAGSHQQSVGSLGEHQSGCVGSSAEALAGMAGKWRQVTSRHRADLDNQATHLDTAARLLSYMEARNAAKVRSVGVDL